MIEETNKNISNNLEDINLLKVVGSENEIEEFLSKTENIGASLTVVETEEKYCIWIPKSTSQLLLEIKTNRNKIKNISNVKDKYEMRKLEITRLASETKIGDKI